MVHNLKHILGAFAGAVGLTLATPALASGTASPAPPKAPEVDFATLPESAKAQPPDYAEGKAHPVVARLLLEQTALVPGQPARIGIHLDQADEWHTYWKSPGEIGQPTDIVWTAPDGLTIPPQTYPVPQRFEQEGIVSFGYDDQVLHLSTVEVPADFAPGKHTLTAKVHWLVCKTSCIPGDVELSLPVEVVAAGTAVADNPWAPLFDHYAAQHPSNPLDVTGFGWDFALSQDKIRPNDSFVGVFKLTPRDGATLAKHSADVPWPSFTVLAPYDWSWAPDKVQVQNGPDGTLLVRIEATAYEPDPLPKTGEVGGLFQIQVGDELIQTEISAAFPWAAPDAEITKNDSALLAQSEAAGKGGKGPSAGGHGGEAAAGTVIAVAEGTGTTAAGLLSNLLFAFIGGLILNVMPCVLPVLTLKLYSLVEQTDITAAEQRTAGLAYTGGILASFWALAGTIVAMRVVFGLQVDWGFQFQYPPYVAALATIVFAFGLSLFGVFEIPAFGVGAATEASSKEGVAGYFLTGVFATLLATPCSAPFLGTAAAFAFGAPTIVLFAIFSSVALGLAFPFLIIAFVPAAYRLLPKPGAWMEGFKQLLGFSLVATTIWLVSVLLGQIGPDRTIGFLAFLTTVAIGCWLFGRWGGVAASTGAQVRALAMGSAVAVAGALTFVDLQYAEAAAECDPGTLETDLAWDGHEIPWQPFTQERVDALSGTPVFVDFTADWCLTCKVNERTILNTDGVRGAMEAGGYVPLVADWTRPDPVITEWLHKFGRAGVPFYLILPGDPDAEPIALPEVITPDMVIEALEQGALDGKQARKD